MAIDPLGTRSPALTGADLVNTTLNQSEKKQPPSALDQLETEAGALQPFSPMEISTPPLRGFALRVLSYFANTKWLGPFVSRAALGGFGTGKLRKLSLSQFPPMEQPTFAPPKKPIALPAFGRAKKQVQASSASSIDPLSTLNLEDAPKGSALALRQAYLQKKTTPIEVAKAFFEAAEAAEKGDPPLGAMVLGAGWSAQKDQILKEAAASTVRYEKGESLGPLDGVPFVVKDQIDAAGFATLVGTPNTDANKTGDATIIANLKQAGALCFGKTNMNELGMGVTGQNPHHGPARNPHDKSRGAGGSSGGSAAAVAEGLVPLSVGSDAGGSTRIPAALCGLIGLKPTWGRLDQKGVFPLARTLQQPGPIAKNATDAAAMFSVMAGGVDLSGLNNRDLSDVTIGVDKTWVAHASPEVHASFQAMLDQLEGLGAKIKPVQVRGLNHASLAQGLSYIEACAGTTEGWEGLSAEARLSLALGKAVSPQELDQTKRLRTALLRESQRAFAHVDVILTPTTATVAPKLHPGSESDGELDGKVLDALSRFTVFANLTGLPAVTFPGEPSQEGLPIGIQAIGKPFDDPLLLRIAAASQEA